MEVIPAVKCITKWTKRLSVTILIRSVLDIMMFLVMFNRICFYFTSFTRFPTSFLTTFNFFGRDVCLWSVCCKREVDAKKRWTVWGRNLVINIFDCMSWMGIAASWPGSCAWHSENFAFLQDSIRSAFSNDFFVFLAENERICILIIHRFNIILVWQIQ